jgi:protein-arginine deiminase
MIKANIEYQEKLDNVKSILMNELKLENNDFYEIPLYYWPKSLSKRAKSIIPNMINNLFLGKFMLIPKPFGPQRNGEDVFEEYFRSQVPLNLRLYFIKNWDSYYLLEGDINCGTNTKRLPFKKNWWIIKPEGAYNI